MWRYAFERIKIENTSLLPFGRSVGGGHQELIERRAAEGWRYAGFVPVSVAKGNGSLELFDLVVEREETDHDG